MKFQKFDETRITLSDALIIFFLSSKIREKKQKLIVQCLDINSKIWSWQGIPLSNAPIFFYLVSKLRVEM